MIGLTNGKERWTQFPRLTWGLLGKREGVCYGTQRRFFACSANVAASRVVSEITREESKKRIKTTAHPAIVSALFLSTFVLLSSTPRLLPSVPHSPPSAPSLPKIRRTSKSSRRRQSAAILPSMTTGASSPESTVHRRRRHRKKPFHSETRGHTLRVPARCPSTAPP